MSLLDTTIEEFTAAMASPSPTPGGGGASALVGAIAISLGDMVGELTVGKKEYRDVEYDVRSLMERAQALRERFLQLVDADAEAFAPLAAAYRIPKSAQDREKIMEDALREACRPPMEIMRTCCSALELIRAFSLKGTKIALSDAACGAVLCQSAMQAASVNVFINTKMMQDEDYARELEDEADRMLEEYGQLAKLTFAEVLVQIRKSRW